jgi:hypothetical protein
MSIISRLQSSWRELWTPIKAAEVMKPSEWMRAEAESYRYNMPDGSTYEAQADLYRVLSWVNIAISNMAAIASITKLNVKRMEGERDVDIPNHPFEKLLMRPNPLYSRFEMFNTSFCYYGLNNNAYWSRLKFGQSTRRTFSRSQMLTRTSPVTSIPRRAEAFRIPSKRGKSHITKGSTPTTRLWD